MCVLQPPVLQGIFLRRSCCDPGFFHPAARPELSLLSKPCLLEGLVHPLTAAGSSGMPSAGDFCCCGGLVLFFYWGVSLTEFRASHMGFASLPPRDWMG